MKLKCLLFTICCSLALFSYAQDRAPMGGNGPKVGDRLEGQRCYKLMVCESDADEITEYNRGINSEAGNRGLLMDLLSQYRSTFTGQAISASQKLLDYGISAIVSLAKDKRGDWQKAVNNECRFVRKLPMQTEILDFYRAPSNVGPLDPRDMLFNGFGCRQVIEYKVSDTITRQEEVFYMRCKVRNDSIGRRRILNHSKFEVEIDSIRFAPFMCDLPNDSLGLNTDNRIGFSFDSRKNLTFNVDATITSSWINQAMQVYTDQELGKFSIVAQIDPSDLDADNVFLYGKSTKPKKSKVMVTGDCFLVPRSYVGTADPETNQDSWGTGQYKVDMQVSESCQLNEQYYQDKSGKWLKERWQPEWNKIKKRKHSPSVWNHLLSIVDTEYVGTAWVTTLLDPLKTVLVQTETGLINDLGAAIGGTATATATATAAGTGTPTGMTGN
jgi:hypothetical protein